MNLIRAGFVIIQADRLRAEAYRLWVKAYRLQDEARSLCGFSFSTYSALREITDELD
mgnify:CR=1 FL=1